MLFHFSDSDNCIKLQLFLKNTFFTGFFLLFFGGIRYDIIVMLYLEELSAASSLEITHF